MATAVGAYFGAPKRPVLAISGDGGFMMGGLAEFNAAVRHHADIVVAVFNDGAYGAEHVQFRNKQLDPALSMFDWPDLAAVAESLGGIGLTARNLMELDTAIGKMQARDRPVLIDVKIDPDKIPYARP